MTRYHGEVSVRFKGYYNNVYLIHNMRIGLIERKFN